MKHLITSLLLLLAILTPATTSAHDFEVDGIYYNIDGTNATVTYKGTSSWNHNTYSGSVTIPATVTYNGTTYSVTSIGDHAFYGCSGLSSVTIPNSVTTIGDYAFCVCTSLTSMTIPNSVSAIGNCLFEECSALTRITVASGNTTYDSRNNCNAIIETASNVLLAGCQNTVIPNSVTAIGNYAFSWCFGLTSMTIPNSVTSIGNNAFSYCIDLTSMTIPNSVTSIGDYVFYQCIGLTSVTIPNSVTTIGDCAFYECHSLTSVTIPNSVSSIGVCAFSDCSGLTNITIPNSVITIGECAFSDCSSLTSVTIPNSVTIIDNSTFSGCINLSSVTIPNSVTEIRETAFDDCRNLNNIDIPNSVTLIYPCAFRNCISLTCVDIPNSVYAIGYNAFEGCSSLMTVSIPNSINEIEECTFKNCGSLTTIIIPSSVTSIGNNAFYSCRGLTTLTIPNSVTSIGNFAFYSCTRLKDVYCHISDPSLVNLGRDAFYLETNYTWRYALRTLYIPKGSLDAYQATGWYNYFGNFEEIETGEGVIDSLQLDRKAAVLIEGDSLQLVATILPEDAYNNTLNWYSDNPAVATVDNNGLVTAHSVGTATITVMTTDGSNLSASCVVTVKSLSSTECFSMPDSEVLHGETITIPVRMNNEATVLAFQTDIYLPEGFTLATDGDDEPMIVPADRLTSDHLIVTETVSSGAVRVVCYTPMMEPISGNEGDLFYITINVPDDAAGDYAIYLRNSRLTIDDFSEVRIPDTGAVINVKTYIPGDVNDTHTVNVADIVTSVRYVMEQNPTPFIFDAADMNGDGEVTVTDIMLIARLIMYPTMNAPRHAPAMLTNSDRMSGEDIALAAGETRTVSISLDNEMQYSAFQLDMYLPDGLTATNFRLTDRAANHALEMNTLIDGTIRALCYTPTIEAIDGTNGSVLTFDVTATSPIAGDISVNGIELVTTSCQTVKPAAFSIGVQTATAVNEMPVSKTIARVEYFNLAGQRLMRPASGVTLIVTTYTDGTRTTTKQFE